MKICLISLALFSSISWSETINFQVTNFNFEYSNPRGEGKADTFSYSNLNPLNEVNVAVDKIEEDFKFTVTGAENQEFELKNAPSFMTEAETIVVKSLNINVAESLKLTMSSGRFSSRKDSLKLDGFSLDCNRVSNTDEQINELINGCTQRMRLKFSKFSNANVKQSLNEIFEGTLQKGSISVQSLDFKVNNRKYELAVDVKADISGTVKSKGQISYDLPNKKIIVKITEVKFGFLNITSRVFSELKKQQTDTFKVKEPFIYYSL